MSCARKGAICQNTDGSFKCECRGGFQMHPSNHICEGKGGWVKRTITSTAVCLSLSLSAKEREPGIEAERSVRFKPGEFSLWVL